MSKQEILSWTSLGVSVSILVYYVLIVFGWPEGIPDFSSRVVKVFFNVFWIAVIIEIIVEISEGKKKVQKDERDFIIEAKGLKVGYSILVITVITALFHIFFTKIFSDIGSDAPLYLESFFIFHFLFIALHLASISKRAIMIYNYRKEY